MTPGTLTVELIPEPGVSGAVPLTLPVRQLVVRLPDGTPIALAAQFGPDGAYAVSKVGDDDFTRLLDMLGIAQTTIRVDWLRLRQGAS
jgi:hypothetical protein